MRLWVLDQVRLQLMMIPAEDLEVIGSFFDRLAGGSPPPEILKVGGTHSLYRWTRGEYRILLVHGEKRWTVVSLSNQPRDVARLRR